MELTAGLAIPFIIPAKLGMLANELKMLSKLAAPVLAAGTVVVEEAGFKVAAPALAAGTGVVVEAGFKLVAAGLATVLAAAAKLGMWAAMLLAMLSTDRGVVGPGGVGGSGGAEPPMAAATPANDGILAAMMSVTPVSVGKMKPWSEAAGGGRGGAP